MKRSWIQWEAEQRRKQKLEKDRLYQAILEAGTMDSSNAFDGDNRIAQDSAPVTPVDSTVSNDLSSSIPFMITKSMMKVLVEDLNYPRRVVYRMTPMEAQHIIKNNIKHQPPPRTIYDSSVSS